MKDYTATYEAQSMNGERGMWWQLYHRGRLIAEGWTRGRKHHAEAEVRETIRNRDALHSAAGLA